MGDLNNLEAFTTTEDNDNWTIEQLPWQQVSPRKRKNEKRELLNETSLEALALMGFSQYGSIVACGFGAAVCLLRFWANFIQHA